MTEEDRCIHDMLPGTCVLCQEKPPRRRMEPGQFRRGASSVAPAPQYQPGSVMAAKFAGFCLECRAIIEPGEMIQMGDDEKWVHSECL